MKNNTTLPSMTFWGRHPRVTGLSLSVALATLILICLSHSARAGDKPDARIISPTIGSIEQTVSATGTVKPRNRLEILPPVSGRIEQIDVKEGQAVKAGTQLASMSSTDRATLIDAARGKGEDEWKYWQSVYKPIVLVAPMDATVIVAKLQPGQVVSVVDPIVVLADQLIVQASLDETDIGRVSEGQTATITLDAFPEKPVSATVEHIYYESVTESNVTVYKVDLKINGDIPDFFRSGMNAQVAFQVAHSDSTLLLPLETIDLTGQTPTVTLLENGKEVKVFVTLGITNDRTAEVKSGLTAASQVVVKSNKLNLTASESGKNPFMPSRPTGTKKSSSKSGGGPPP